MRAGSSSKWLGLPVILLLAPGVLLGLSVKSDAAGTSIGKPPIFGAGIACDATLLPWRSVWFGHFSGGRAYYRRGAPAIRLVWEDQKLCFPSRRQCLSWQKVEHRRYRQIEGYTTCLRLR